MDGIVNMHRIKSDKASVTMKTFRAVLILYTVNQNWKFDLKNLTAIIRILRGFFRAKASNDCQYRGVAQRAKFTGKVHKPPLGVNVISFELNGCNVSASAKSLLLPKIELKKTCEIMRSFLNMLATVWHIFKICSLSYL